MAMRAKTKISERRACQLMAISRTVLHYAPGREADGGPLRCRIVELAAQRRRFGYRRIHALLRREGAEVNVKRVHRLYRLEKLRVRRGKRREGVAVERRPLQRPTAPNQVWSIDFVSDSLEHGGKALYQRVSQRGVGLRLIQACKPAHNGNIETFQP